MRLVDDPLAPAEVSPFKRATIDLGGSIGIGAGPNVPYTLSIEQLMMGTGSAEGTDALPASVVANEFSTIPDAEIDFVNLTFAATDSFTLSAGVSLNLTGSDLKTGAMAMGDIGGDSQEATTIEFSADATFEINGNLTISSSIEFVGADASATSLNIAGDVTNMTTAPATTRTRPIRPTARIEGGRPAGPVDLIDDLDRRQGFCGKRDDLDSRNVTDYRSPVCRDNRCTLPRAWLKICESDRPPLPRGASCGSSPRSGDPQPAPSRRAPP